MKYKTLITLSAILPFSLAVPAFAQDAPPEEEPSRHEKILEKLDKDGDKAISKEEFLAGERAQKNPEKAAEMFAKLDANGDGKLDPSDREARMKEHFAKMDTNGDGSLSWEEFSQNRPERPKKGKGGKQACAGAQAGKSHPMLKLDKDSDGEISQEEFLASPRAQKDSEKAQKIFSKLDANADGKLSEEELPKKGSKGKGKKNAQNKDAKKANADTENSETANAETE